MKTRSATHTPTDIVTPAAATEAAAVAPPPRPSLIAARARHVRLASALLWLVSALERNPLPLLKLRHMFVAGRDEALWDAVFHDATRRAINEKFVELFDAGDKFLRLMRSQALETTLSHCRSVVSDHERQRSVWIRASEKTPLAQIAGALDAVHSDKEQEELKSSAWRCRPNDPLPDARYRRWLTEAVDALVKMGALTRGPGETLSRTLSHEAVDLMSMDLRK